MIEGAELRSNQAPRIEYRGVFETAVQFVCCAAVVLFSLQHLRPSAHIDLYPTYVAARLANESRWDLVYMPTVWSFHGAAPEWDARARSLGIDSHAGTSFVYHPWYLLALRPLAALVSYADFQDLYVGASELCVVLVGFGIVRLLRIRSLPVQLLICLLVAHASPTLNSLELGQNTLAALAFSLAAAVAWRSRRCVLLGAVFAGLAWACKPWCPALVVLCPLLRGWRAGALVSLALVVGMIGLPVMLLPSALMHDYATVNLELMRQSVPGWNNLSLLSIMERSTNPDWSLHLLEWFPAHPSPGLRIAASAAAVAVLVAAGWLWWRRRPDPTWTAAAWLAFMPMPLGICWTHYFLFTLPLGCLVIMSHSSPKALRAAAMCLVALVFAMVPLYAATLEDVAGHVAEPVGAPWLRALPMALLAGVLLGSLRFANQFDGSQTSVPGGGNPSSAQVLGRNPRDS